jgi:aminodeoxychorismate synthase component I
MTSLTDKDTVPTSTHFLHAPQPVPLVVSIPAARLDVFDAYHRLASLQRPSCLLESGKGYHPHGRHSFIATDPYLMLAGKDSAYVVDTGPSRTACQGSPWTALATLLRNSVIGRPDGVPPFFGGAVGMISYDLVRQFESIPALTVDDLLAPDILFLFFDQVAAFDHATETLHLIFCPPLSRYLAEPRDKLHREGSDRLAEWHARLTTGASTQAPDTQDVRIVPEQTQPQYEERVQRCQEFIRAGDIYQANLSHRFTVDFTSQDGGRRELARHLYQRLRRLNPAPFAGLFESPDWTLVSSSPERLIRLDGRCADTRPIAGTRARGDSLDEDRRLVEELLSNAKERAEHLMLVDLERNDLGRVSRYGTVRTDALMEVERYSHVSHLVSNIRAELRAGLDAFDLIRAMFPGGTITGVPKIRCMEIIEGLEPVRRGPYTGSLGYMSWNGDIDFNIIIRTIVLGKDRGYLQVGAGIVADSRPDREYQETLLKAEALRKALGHS